MNFKLRERLRSFIVNSKHVMNVSYKPTNDEFKKTAKIMLIGILLIGVSGFVIGVIVSLLISGTVSFI
ncbi:protein translocase SEC61 complex subunit gamma [Candidatus Marsarchaeota archaeon]|jgi:protein translocase SEC61 complex gamma subunit|nr:protein translocase SEC61 complex subunit gamma [Candidatus Marsarchaeota archaeon]MCL5090307.1 protein translocase SEC61 complex subunit gamma [Candidatus Marsarchaeota archaeon]